MVQTLYQKAIQTYIRISPYHRINLYFVCILEPKLVSNLIQLIILFAYCCIKCDI